MQERADRPLFVETFATGEVEHVDAVEPPIRRLADQSLEGRRAVGVSRLAQDGEQRLGFAHGRTIPCGFLHRIELLMEWISPQTPALVSSGCTTGIWRWRQDNEARCASFRQWPSVSKSRTKCWHSPTRS